MKCVVNWIPPRIRVRSRNTQPHLNDFLYENLNFLYENLNVLYANLRFSLWKILMIFFMIFLMIHKISYYKVRVSTGGEDTRWLRWQFLYGLQKQRWQAGCWLYQCVLRNTLAGSKTWFLCLRMTLYWNYPLVYCNQGFLFLCNTGIARYSFVYWTFEQTRLSFVYNTAMKKVSFCMLKFKRLSFIYGVATTSRMLKNIGLFCKRDLQKRPIFCKETCIFKHPTNRSHPIQWNVACVSAWNWSAFCCVFFMSEQNSCATTHWSLFLFRPHCLSLSRTGLSFYFALTLSLSLSHWSLFLFRSHCLSLSHKHYVSDTNIRSPSVSTCVSLSLGPTPCLSFFLSCNVACISVWKHSAFLCLPVLVLICFCNYEKNPARRRIGLTLSLSLSLSLPLTLSVFLSYAHTHSLSLLLHLSRSLARLLVRALSNAVFQNRVSQRLFWCGCGQ